MSPLGRTLLMVALTSFAAGIGVGLAIPAAAASLSERATADRHREFIAQFTATYGLDAEQVRRLRTVLLLCEDELMSIAGGFDPRQWPPEARSRLLQANRRKQTRVEYLLNEEQRARYRKDMGSIRQDN